MIELKNVTKRFDDVTALEDFSLTVPRGSVYGLVGPNGAGKTTVLRTAAGILRQDAGEVLAGGEPVFENPAVKASTAYIPDEVRFLTRSGIDGLRRFYERVYPAYDRDVFEKLREVFRLDTKKPLPRFSRGMKKQAAFWLALPLRPRRLILDEPMDGLDPVMRRQIWGIVMGEVAEGGMSVLVSSHNLRELEDVCDHVGMMNHGKMLLEQDLAQLEEEFVKLRLVLPEGGVLPQGLDILHEDRSGQLITLILRGDREEILGAAAAVRPVFLDTVPLKLEEIFLYVLGGENYEVKEILL